jgi:hypothetical protein
MATTNQYTLDVPGGNARNLSGPHCNQKTVNLDSEIEDVSDQLLTLANPEPKPHDLFRHCMPPHAPIYHSFSVFLAGSIEMGAAIQWQKQLASLLSPLPITVNNPRRGDWDITATQEAKNAAFRAQVEWELTALEKSDVICFFFDVNTKSPVSLLELGLWARSGKVVVCCDKRYWRSGNVHLVCERYSIPYVESFAELVPEVEKMLYKKGMRLDENGDLVGSSWKLLRDGCCKWFWYASALVVSPWWWSRGGSARAARLV